MKKGFISTAKKARIALAILTAIGCSFGGTGHVLADTTDTADTVTYVPMGTIELEWNSTRSVAVGTNSNAKGTVGDDGVENAAVAVGNGSIAEGSGSIAIGQDAYSYDYSVSIGQWAGVDYTDSSGERTLGSVAIGAYSRATESNVVSVGSGLTEGDAGYFTYRRIVNVADAIDNHDAVTYGQVITSVKLNEDTKKLEFYTGTNTGTGEAALSLDLSGAYSGQLLKADTYTLSADNSYSITLKTNDGTNGPTIKLDTASLGGSGSGSGSLTQAQFNEFLANSTDYTDLKNTVDSKADTTTVNSALANKANTEDVNNALANKADTTTVNTALADKVNKDGSNIDNSEGKWSSALGTGTVTSGDTNLVTGGTIYTAIQTVKDDVTQNTTDIATNKANIETNKNNIETNKSAIGTLTELKTTNQSSLVGAINEVKASSDKNLETAKTYTDTAKADAISTAKTYSDEKLKEANTYTDTEVSKVKEAVGTNSSDIAENKAAIAANTGAIRSLDKKVNKVGAGAAALAALHPLDFDPEEKLTFAAGYGNYQGENAVALGAFYRPNENVMFSVAGNMGNGENMVNAGVSFALGSGSTTTTSRAVMAKKLAAQNEQIAALNNTVAAQDAKLSQQDERLAEQDAKLSAQDKEIAELKAMVAALAGQR